jgi:N-acyl-D-aspartate/D-glutamate deacylase
MADFDLIIRGGRIVDGTGVPSFVGDLAIKDGRVAKIDGLTRAVGERELDATGLVVAPGVIDLHTHYDAQLFFDPYCTISGWHGVTSVVIGNCGFGFAPVRTEDRERAMLRMTRNEAIEYDVMASTMPWDWVSFPEFLDSLERQKLGVNVTSLCPIAPLMLWVLGESRRYEEPTADEVKEMQHLLHVAMDAGACGFSIQKLGFDSVQPDFDGGPMPTDVMSDDLILAFADVLRERDEGWIQITYAPFEVEKVNLAASVVGDTTMKFIEELAERAQRPVLHNVIIPIADAPEIYRGAMEWLADAQGRGLRIYGQGDHVRNWFQLTYEHFNLWDSAPAWKECFLGTDEEKLEHLADPKLRQRMIDEEPLLLSAAMGASLPKFTLTKTGGSPSLERYVGKAMKDIAADEGRHHIDVMLDIALESQLKAEFKSTFVKAPKAEFTADMLKSPYIVPGISDGGAHTKFFIGGAYPTDLIRWLVKEEGLLTLEQVHQKLSFLPAQVAGLRDRGAIREGAPADIIVYDLAELRPDPDFDYDQEFDLPGGDWRRVQRAVGYRWTIVNGEVTFENGVTTGATPGHLVRQGRD